MGEGHLLAPPQFDQRFGVVAARIDLLEAEHCGDVRQTPGVYVEHRRDGHVDIAGAHQLRVLSAPHRNRGGQRMQDQLPVGEVGALGITRGAGGVEGGGDRVFIEIGEGIARRGVGEQSLVFAYTIGQHFTLAFAIGQQQRLFDSGQLTGNGLIQRYEIAVDEDEAILGMVHGVEDLLGRQAHVDGMHHGSNHRNGEHAFQVAVAVPVHHGHGIPGLDPSRGQHVGQPRDALVEGAVVETQPVAIDDLAATLVTLPREQQALDQQRVLVGILGGFDHSGLQHKGFLLLVL